MGRYVILRHDCENGRGLSPFLSAETDSAVAEQKGTVPLSAGRLRTSDVHWDLMLESGETLRTWALAAEPAPNVPIAAEQLPDHRLLYLDYEGPISGNRGAVIRWDAGKLELISAADRYVGDRALSPSPLTGEGLPAVSLSNGSEGAEAMLVIALSGDRLHGEVILARSSAAANSWQFIFHPVKT